MTTTRITAKITPWEMQELMEHLAEHPDLYERDGTLYKWVHKHQGHVCMTLELRISARTSTASLCVTPGSWTDKAAFAYALHLLESNTSYKLRCAVQAIIAVELNDYHKALSVTQRVLQLVYDTAKQAEEATPKPVRSLYLRRLIAAGKQLQKETT